MRAWLFSVEVEFDNGGIGTTVEVHRGVEEFASVGIAIDVEALNQFWRVRFEVIEHCKRRVVVGLERHFDDLHGVPDTRDSIRVRFDLFAIFGENVTKVRGVFEVVRAEILEDFFAECDNTLVR